MRVHQHLEASDSQGVTLVRLLDRELIDGIGIENLGQELLGLIESEDRSKLVLDFSLVDFLGSAALGKLIALHRKVAAKNGMMRLCCICPDIHDVFTTTKLDRVFGIEDNAADAVAAFACAAEG
jgi:anti-sigma B factor antagonist